MYVRDGMSIYNKDDLSDRPTSDFLQNLIIDLDEPLLGHKLRYPRFFETGSFTLATFDLEKMSKVDSSSTDANYEDAIKVSIGALPEDVREHITNRMKSKLFVNNDLRESVIDAIRGIKSYLDDRGDVRADIDREIGDPKSIDLIEVEVDVNSVDEWQEIRKKVRKIVEKSEKEDVVLYTFVDRKHQ